MVGGHETTANTLAWSLYHLLAHPAALERAGWVGANAFLRRQPGHIEAMRDDVGVAARFNLRF